MNAAEISRVNGTRPVPNRLFTDNCKLTPYWWDEVPRPQPEEKPLPRSVDVAVIGSGYTGLNAALQVARGGRNTIVLDAEDAGWGAARATVARSRPASSRATIGWPADTAPSGPSTS